MKVSESSKLCPTCFEMKVVLENSEGCLWIVHCICASTSHWSFLLMPCYSSEVTVSFLLCNFSILLREHLDPHFLLFFNFLNNPKSLPLIMAAQSSEQGKCFPVEPKAGSNWTLPLSLASNRKKINKRKHYISRYYK